MVKACDLTRGQVVKINDAPHMTERIQLQSPSARGASTLYKVRFRNVYTKQKVDQTFRGDDTLKETDLDRRETEYVYRDASGYTFMDLSDYSQFTLTREEIEDEVPFLSEGLQGITALISEDRVLGILLPPVVELEITETGPAMKGASATARAKPATLSTGHVVQVPEYLASGEVVRVDTRTGAFVSRA